MGFMLFTFSFPLFNYCQIGDWNSTKGAILFDKISRNMETLPSRRSLAGRHFKVVVAEVTKRHSQIELTLF